MQSGGEPLMIRSVTFLKKLKWILLLKMNVNTAMEDMLNVAKVLSTPYSFSVSLQVHPQKS